MLFVLVCASATACAASAKITEQRILQARDNRGNVAYFRVLIEGDARIAKTSYRAGLYDADALDALLSSVSEEEAGVPKALIRARHDAIEAIAAQYYETLRTGSREEVQRAAERLTTALRSAHALSNGSDFLGTPGARRKYALILSAQASEIEETIQAISEEKETTDVVMTALASQRRADYIRTVVEAEKIDPLRAALDGVALRAAKPRRRPATRSSKR